MYQCSCTEEEFVRVARYLVLSISLGSGGNRLWYLPLAALPVNASTGALDLGRYDMRLPAARRGALPLAKLVDDLRASWAVVATNNTQWTLHTSFDAARYRCGSLEPARAARILCSPCPPSRTSARAAAKRACSLSGKQHDLSLCIGKPRAFLPPCSLSA